VCIFFNFDHLRITLQCSDLIWGIKSCAHSLPLPPLILSYLQALIHGFLWWWASSWLIFSLKWNLQSSFFLLHSAAIKLLEAKGSIDEEDPRPTSSTWSYVTFPFSFLSSFYFHNLSKLNSSKILDRGSLWLVPSPFTLDEWRLRLVPKLWFFLVGGLQKVKARVQKNSR